MAVSTREKEEKRVELIVSNWFRNNVKNDSISIEYLIKVIFEFHRILDSFDPALYSKGKLELTNNNSRVTVTAKERVYVTAYGATIIPSMENGEFVWYIKYVAGAFHGINIGIDESTAKHVDESFLGNLSGNQYVAMHMEGGTAYAQNRGTQTGPGWKSIGDILTMKLQFVEKQKMGSVIMKVNDGEEMTICDKVKRAQGLSYRLAIFLHHPGSAVELLPYID